MKIASVRILAAGAALASALPACVTGPKNEAPPACPRACSGALLRGP